LFKNFSVVPMPGLVIDWCLSSYCSTKT